MSKEKKEVLELTTVENVALAIKGDKVGEFLKSKERKGFSLTSNYLEMETGETRKFIVMQLSKMTVKDEESEEKNGTKEIDSLLMIDENGSTISASQTVLVNSVKGSLIEGVPLAIEVVCKGEVKMSGGRKYHDFDVFPLD